MKIETLTAPQIAERLDVGRAVIERLIRHYADRLPVPGRVGIIRCWPESIVDQLRALLDEEARVAGRLP
jgi:hypothetical protein